MFVAALVALAAEILWAINTARLAKKQTLNVGFALPATIAFAVFHSCWWMSYPKSKESIIIYLVGAIASVAFLFGVAFATTGCMKLTNQGELCINKDNKVFQVIKRLPLNFDGKSLCSISWLAAILIFVLPVVMSAIGVAAAIITLVVCAWTFQNPWEYYKEIMQLKGWPDTEMRLYQKSPLKGFYVSPLPYLTVLGVLGGLVFMIIVCLPVLAGIGAVLLVSYLIGTLLALLAIKRWQSLTKEKQQAHGKIVNEVYENLSGDSEAPVMRSMYVWVVFWQVFKHKFCPKLKYCDKEEMRNY